MNTQKNEKLITHSELWQSGNRVDKGGAGGRHLLYKTHRCILNYVNVFLVKTIKRIIFLKNASRRPSVKRKLVSVGLFLSM